MVQRVTVVADTEVFLNSILASDDIDEYLDQLDQQLDERNNEYLVNMESNLNGGGNPCADLAPVTQIVTKGKVVIQREKTFGTVSADSSQTSLSSSGKLTIVFSRPIFFPYAILSPYE